MEQNYSPDLGKEYFFFNFQFEENILSATQFSQINVAQNVAGSGDQDLPGSGIKLNKLN